MNGKGLHGGTRKTKPSFGNFLLKIIVLVGCCFPLTYFVVHHWPQVSWLKYVITVSIVVITVNLYREWKHRQLDEPTICDTRFVEQADDEIGLKVTALIFIIFILTFIVVTMVQKWPGGISPAGMIFYGFTLLCLMYLLYLLPYWLSRSFNLKPFSCKVTEKEIIIFDWGYVRPRLRGVEGASITSIVFKRDEEEPCEFYLKTKDGCKYQFCTVLMYRNHEIIDLITQKFPHIATYRQPGR